MTRRLVRAVPPAAAWLLTRGFMLWVLTHSGPAALGNGRVAHEVWGLYHHWAHVLARGAFPAHDTLWQYPPGAGLVMLAPAALPGLTYLQAFVVLTLLADATVAFALARSGAREGGSRLGFWYWTCGLPRRGWPSRGCCCGGCAPGAGRRRRRATRRWRRCCCSRSPAGCSARST
ncbi:hypothetical protein [Streptomyces sp. NPDC003299]